MRGYDQTGATSHTWHVHWMNLRLSTKCSCKCDLCSSNKFLICSWLKRKCQQSGNSLFATISRESGYISRMINAMDFKLRSEHCLRTRELFDIHECSVPLCRNAWSSISSSKHWWLIRTWTSRANSSVVTQRKYINVWVQVWPLNRMPHSHSLMLQYCTNTPDITCQLKLDYLLFM